MEFLADKPIKGQAFRTYFRIVAENDTGKNFSDVTVLFPAVSIDNQAFKNTTNAPVAVPTMTAGMHEAWYYLDLTAAETNGNVVKLSVHSGGSGGRQVVSQILYTTLQVELLDKPFITIPGFHFQKDQVIAIQFEDATRKVYVHSKDGYKMAQFPSSTEYNAAKAKWGTMPEYLKVVNFLFNKNRLRAIQLTDSTKNIYITADDAYKMGIPVPTQAEYDALKAVFNSLSI